MTPPTYPVPSHGSHDSGLTLEEQNKAEREHIRVMENKPFLGYCPSCKRKHRVNYQKCPTCNTYETAQPVSERVQGTCQADYSCDGCQAYREHQA